jgi:hypothetical protein
MAYPYHPAFHRKLQANNLRKDEPSHRYENGRRQMTAKMMWAVAVHFNSGLGVKAIPLTIINKNNVRSDRFIVRPIYSCLS